jgi:hypothetical protein
MTAYDANPDPAGLLAYDDFAVSPTTTLDNLTSGKGWAKGWDIGEGIVMPDAFVIKVDAPLTFSNLHVAGNYLSHAHQDIGRQLDLRGAFKPFVANSEISVAGTVLWLSSLIRVEASNNQDPVFVTLHSDMGFGFHYYGDATVWAAGVDPKNNVSHWSLFKGHSPYDAGVQVVQSNKPMVRGTAALLVVKLELRSNDADISLYVNPANLSGPEPGTPDAKITLQQSLQFRALAWSAGDTPASFDEVRMGTSFAAVTPAP